MMINKHVKFESNRAETNLWMDGRTDRQRDKMITRFGALIIN